MAAGIPVTDQNGGEIAASYKGVGVTLKSTNLLPLLLLGCLMLIALTGGYLLHLEIDRQAAAGLRIEQQHSLILEEMRVITYMLSLPENDRPRLPMPSAMGPKIYPGR